MRHKNIEKECGTFAWYLLVLLMLEKPSVLEHNMLLQRPDSVNHLEYDILPNQKLATQSLKKKQSAGSLQIKSSHRDRIDALKNPSAIRNLHIRSSKQNSSLNVETFLDMVYHFPLKCRLNTGELYKHDPPTSQVGDG